jgi:hypothetical protein
VALSSCSLLYFNPMHHSRPNCRSVHLKEEARSEGGGGENRRQRSQPSPGQGDHETEEEQPLRGRKSPWEFYDGENDPALSSRLSSLPESPGLSCGGLCRTGLMRPGWLRVHQCRCVETFGLEKGLLLSCLLSKSVLLTPYSTPIPCCL